MTISRFPPQTWQIINENPLTVLETVTREPVDNLCDILDSKLDFPFRISLSGYVLTVNPSEVQVLKSDGNGSTTNTFVVATAPIQNKYTQFVSSTLNVSSGVTTGDFPSTPTSPSMSPNYYVWLGIEAFNTGIIGLNWGTQSNTISGATFPSFNSGTAIALILLQANGSGGTWSFIGPIAENTIIFKGSGGGGGSNGTGNGNPYLLEVSPSSVDYNSASGIFAWSQPMYIVHPFYGKYVISTGSLSGIVNDSILYSTIYLPQKTTSDGALGTIELSDTTYFNDNDSVIIGDANSAQVSGYVYGTPVGNTLTVDDGFGVLKDLSAFTLSQGAWVIKTNVSLLAGTLNTGVLKPDISGNLPLNIYIAGMCDGTSVFLTNGMDVTRNWYYEESFLSLVDINPGDSITLPTDSRNNYAITNYKNGSGNLEVYLNGLPLERNKVSLTSYFQPISYNSGTGILRVPDAVDLSAVKRGSTFQDASGNSYVIYGNIINIAGVKQVTIGTSLSVSLLSGALIYQQDYKENGSLNQLINTITATTFIPSNSIFKFRIISLINRTVVNNKWESSWITSNLTTVFTHNLNTFPSLITMVYNNNGTYEYLDVFSYVASFTSTTITINWLGLTLDSLHSVQIYASI